MRNWVCFLFSHEYVLLQKTDADGEKWRCVRCARVRYNLPRTGASSGGFDAGTPVG